MLVLSRKPGERVMIDVGGVRVTVVLVDVDRNKVRLGFVAPLDVQILREELLPPERKEGNHGG
jgi:carbon storage regulator CsrA